MARGDGAVVLLHPWTRATGAGLDAILHRPHRCRGDVRDRGRPGRAPGRAGMRTVLAVDGGNSKTDVALVAEDGRLLAAMRGPTTSHQAVTLEVGMARLAGLVAAVRDAAGSDALVRPRRRGRLCPGRRRHTARRAGAGRGARLGRIFETRPRAERPRRGTASRHGPWLGRDRDLWRRCRGRRTGAGWPPRPARGTRPDLGRLGRRQRRRLGGAGGGHPGARRTGSPDHARHARARALRASGPRPRSPPRSIPGRSARTGSANYRR